MPPWEADESPAIWWVRWVSIRDARAARSLEQAHKPMAQMTPDELTLRKWTYGSDNH